MKKLFLILLLLSFGAPLFMQASEKPSFKVEVKGSGSPVLLIPGLGCSGDVWDSTVEVLAKRYECHILTLPGFAGQPPIPYENDYLQQVKEQILAYLQEKNLQEVGLIGHSLGGFLSLQLASEQPERFSSLFIVDALPFLPAVQMPGVTPEAVKPIAENMRRTIQQQPEENREANQRITLQSMVTGQEELEKILRWNLSSDRAVMAQAMYEMYITDMRNSISAIQAPVRVLGAWIAYKDYGVTRELSLQAYKAQYANLPTATVEMSDKARHFIMYDDPQFYFAQLQQAFPYK